MVKGCQKKTIHIKDTGSSYFEEAYFVLKPGAEETYVPEGDMISEALRIGGESVGASFAQKRRRGAPLKSAVTYAVGLISGVIAATLLFLICLP